MKKHAFKSMTFGNEVGLDVNGVLTNFVTGTVKCTCGWDDTIRTPDIYISENAKRRLWERIKPVINPHIEMANEKKNAVEVKF